MALFRAEESARAVDRHTHTGGRGTARARRSRPRDDPGQPASWQHGAARLAVPSGSVRCSGCGTRMTQYARRPEGASTLTTGAPASPAWVRVPAVAGGLQEPQEPQGGERRGAGMGVRLRPDEGPLPSLGRGPRKDDRAREERLARRSRGRRRRHGSTSWPRSTRMRRGFQEQAARGLHDHLRSWVSPSTGLPRRARTAETRARRPPEPARGAGAT